MQILLLGTLLLVEITQLMVNLLDFVVDFESLLLVDLHLINVSFQFLADAALAFLVL